MKKCACVVCFVWLCAVLSCAAKDIRCYECTSYMKQCEDKVDATNNIVYKTTCNSKCYARIAEDGAIYRGCFSYFEDATGLEFDYTGCKNQTWNNKELVWCLCESDLCNGQSFNRMMTRGNSHSNYSPNVNFVDGAENYADADYIHDNEDTKLMLNSPSMVSYGKEGPSDDTYQEPHMKLWESGYGDAYRVYDSQENTHEPRTEYHNEQYNIGPQYSRSDDVRDSYNFQPEVKTIGGGHVGYDAHQENQSYKEEEEEEEDSSKVSPELASQIRCSKTGYYQNPHDCRQFIACLMVPHGNAPIMHLMRCPSGLVFDNHKKICLTYSSTCNTGTDYYEYDNTHDLKPDEYEVNPYANEVNPYANEVKQYANEANQYANEVNHYANEVKDDQYSEVKSENSPQLNYDSKLYDSEKKVDTTGFVQSGGDKKSYANKGSYANDKINYANDVNYDQGYNTDYDLYDNEYGSDIYNVRPKK